MVGDPPCTDKKPFPGTDASDFSYRVCPGENGITISQKLSANNKKNIDFDKFKEMLGKAFEEWRNKTKDQKKVKLVVDLEYNIVDGTNISGLFDSIEKVRDEKKVETVLLNLNMKGNDKLATGSVNTLANSLAKYEKIQLTHLNASRAETFSDDAFKNMSELRSVWLGPFTKNTGITKTLQSMDISNSQMSKTPLSSARKIGQEVEKYENLKTIIADDKLGLELEKILKNEKNEKIKNIKILTKAPPTPKSMSAVLARLGLL